MSDLYTHLDAIRKIADETFKPAEAKAKPDFLDLDKDGDKTEPMKSAAKEKEVKENPETDYEGSFEYELYGDDGESAYGTIHYKAINGVVDPKSLSGEYEYDGNHKIDDDLATQMVQPGGDEHEEALKAAQEDYDYEAERMRSKSGEEHETVTELDDKQRTASSLKYSSDSRVAYFDKMMKRYGPKLMELIIDHSHIISTDEKKGQEKLKKYGQTEIGFMDRFNHLDGVEEDLTYMLMTAVEKGEEGLIDFFYDRVEQAKKAGNFSKTSRIPDPDEYEESVEKEGAFKEMDTVKKEKARLYARLKDLKAKYNAQMAGQSDGEPEDTEEEIEKIEKELGMSQESINTEAMKKDINEAITMTAETPEEASVLMQILKLAGVTPVTQDMINQPEAEKSQEEPVGPQTAGDQMRATMDKISGEEPTEEFANEPNVDYQNTNDLVNTHSGGLNRQKVQVKKGYPGDNDLAEVNDLEQLANKLREQYNALYRPLAEAHGKATCGCDENSCSHCKGYHGLDEVGKKCECCGNEIEAVKTEAKNPYAVGMAQAMKSTGDTPPLEKSTIKKAHDIAKAVAKNN